MVVLMQQIDTFNYIVVSSMSIMSHRDISVDLRPILLDSPVNRRQLWEENIPGAALNGCDL